jgi:hypothetical protein
MREPGVSRIVVVGHVPMGEVLPAGMRYDGNPLVPAAFQPYAHKP